MTSNGLQTQFAGTIIQGDFAQAKAMLENHPTLATAILSHPDMLDSCAAIILAASYNRVALLKLLLEMGVDIETRYEKEGWNALHAAAQRGLVEVGSVLLAAGADVNAEDNDRRKAKPLLWALRHRHYEFAELLLQYGADINCRWNDGYSFLHHEAKDGKNEPLQFMLEQGADPNIRDHRYGKGSTPLHGAARHDRLNAAKILLRYGAEINAQNEEGLTPLDMTQFSKKGKVVDFLKAHGGQYGIYNKD